MQQRRVRLGDVLDDYCPRERRVTNTAVVAMIEDEVKRTRCTTCDAEHEYKHAKVPAPRRKKPVAATAATCPSSHRSCRGGRRRNCGRNHRRGHRGRARPFSWSRRWSLKKAPEPADVEEPAVAGPTTSGPVHRPLIRATLPRPRGSRQSESRPTSRSVRAETGSTGSAMAISRVAIGRRNRRRDTPRVSRDSVTHVMDRDTVAPRVGSTVATSSSGSGNRQGPSGQRGGRPGQGGGGQASWSRPRTQARAISTDSARRQRRPWPIARSLT